MNEYEPTFRWWHDHSCPECDTRPWSDPSPITCQHNRKVHSQWDALRDRLEAEAKDS